MYSPLVHARIERVGLIIERIKELDNEFDILDDESEFESYEEEREALVDELDEAGGECLILLESYFQDCEDENIPVYLDYYRVYRALVESIPRDEE